MGGFFFEFEAVRTSMLRAGADGAFCCEGAITERVRGLAASFTVVPGAAAARECGGGAFFRRRLSGLLPERGF